MKREFKFIKMCVLLLILILSLSSCGSVQGEKEESQDTETTDQITEEMVMPEDLGTTTDFKKFATIDIYGNEVSDEIFKDYKYTLIDVWGTYCGPCIDAMPELKRVYDQYKDKGVNVMGIVVDVQNADRTPAPEAVLNARKITETQGADFTHMLIPKSVLYSVINDIQAIPTQFLVDSEGNIVTDYFKGGKNYEKWCEFLNEKLETNDLES